MIIKICGIQNEDTLLCCEKNNVNFFGMIFYEKSPRNISIENANILQKKSKDLKLHFVGAIQSRKTKSILNYCDVIHSIDRMKIVKLIKDYEKLNETVNKKYFIQVNIGNEDQKSGVMLDDIDLFIEDCKSKYELRIEGLMCLPPINEDPTRHFNNLKHIRDLR